MIMTDWYYDYYNPGTFPHQQDLCDAVTWTPYNLEGRVVTKTSLSPSAGNPLTIRLLALNEALSQLTDCVGELDSEIKAITKQQFETKNFSGMSVNYFGKGDSTNTGGAPLEIIKFDGIDAEHKIPHIIIQSALYKFFTNSEVFWIDWRLRSIYYTN
jgi:hypothetical protein